MKASQLIGIVSGLAALAALYVTPAHLATNPKSQYSLATMVSDTRVDDRGDDAPVFGRDITLKLKLSRNRGADCRENKDPGMECAL